MSASKNDHVFNIKSQMGCHGDPDVISINVKYGWRKADRTMSSQMVQTYLLLSVLCNYGADEGKSQSLNAKIQGIP